MGTRPTDSNRSVSTAPVARARPPGLCVADTEAARAVAEFHSEERLSGSARRAGAGTLRGRQLYAGFQERPQLFLLCPKLEER